MKTYPYLNRQSSTNDVVDFIKTIAVGESLFIERSDQMFNQISRIRGNAKRLGMKFVFKKAIEYDDVTYDTTFSGFVGKRVQ